MPDDLSRWLRQFEEHITTFEIGAFGADLRKALRSAHMPVTLERYLHSIHLNLAAGLGIYCILLLFFVLSGFTLNLGPFATGDLVFWLLLFCALIREFT